MQLSADSVCLFVKHAQLSLILHTVKVIQDKQKNKTQKIKTEEFLFLSFK